MEFKKINFKTGFHGTIHTFKNYLVIVFLIFNNKQYSNRQLIGFGNSFQPAID